MSKLPLLLLVVGVLGACSSDPAQAPNTSSAPLTCTNAGHPGADVDRHCIAAQAVEAAACTEHVDAGPGDQSDDACEYGTTLAATEADDDDCKYHVTWSSSDLCTGDGGVDFEVQVAEKITGAAVSIPGGLLLEVFVPKDAAATCDDDGTHASPKAPPMTETTPGEYQGRIAFDRSGPWTVRFHVHEECLDEAETSPHGHVAFRIDLP